MPPKDPLLLPMPDKWRAFIDAYCENGFNASQAAITAGYSEKSDSYWRILKDPRVRQELEIRFKERQIGSDEILARFSEIARGEAGNYITETGNVDFKSLIADGKGYLIRAIRDTRNGKSVEFYSSIDALQEAAKILGMYRQKVEISGRDGGPIELAAVKFTAEEELRRIEARKRILERQLEERTESD